jgi:uncharacterized protein (TIGR02186 family)
MIRLVCFIIAICASTLHAEEIVLGMDNDTIAITTDFDGSSILIFGAVKRQDVIPEDPLEVIVTVAGPIERLEVRRMARQFGIWVNSDKIQVDAAPSFYAVSTSNDWDLVLTETEDLRHKVSIPKAIRAVDTKVSDVENFNDALIRVRENDATYSINNGGVQLDQDTLFQTRIFLPAKLTEGDYKTRIFLTRSGQVISKYETTIGVYKVGLEEFLYSLAHEQPFLYAIMSLIIAVAAGWGASTFFRMIRAQ